MTEFMEAKIKNLNAINDWCKKLISDETVGSMGFWIEKAFYFRNHPIDIFGSDDGIRLYDQISTRGVFPVDHEQNNLVNVEIGEELIYKWKFVKPQIVDGYIDAENKYHMMMNFEV